MERLSQQKKVDEDVTNTSTVTELHSKRLETSDRLETDVANSLATEEAKCDKCRSLDINTMYVAGHNVLHCICNRCGYEWVQ